MATTIEEFLEANRDFPVPSADSMVPAVDQQQGAVDAFLAKSDESFVAHNEHMGRLLGVPEDELDEYVKAKRIYYEEAKKARRVKQEAEKPPEEALEVEEPEGADAVPTPVYDRFSKRGDWSIGFDEHWNMLPASEKAAIDPQRAMADGSVDSAYRMKIAMDTAEENLRAQEEGTGEGSAYDTVRYWMDRIPIVNIAGSIVGAKEYLQFRNSVLKVGQKSKSATNVDYMRIATTLKKMEREENHGMIRRVWDTASMLPAYMVEFFLTAGVATTAKGLARAGIRQGTKALVRKTGKRLSQKALVRMPTEVASGAVGVAAQSAAQLHRVAENIAGQMVPLFKFEQDEANALKMVILDDKDTPLDWFKGVAKGYGDTLVEVFTETALGRGAKALTSVAKESATNMALRSLFLKKWLQRAPGRTPNQYAQLVDALKQAGEYQGVLPELVEEVAGDILRGATGISVKGVEDKETGKLHYERDYGIPGKIAEEPGAIDSWQDLGEMGLAFGVLPATFGAVSIAKKPGEAISKAYLGTEKTEEIAKGLGEAAETAKEMLKETERFLQFGFKEPKDRPAFTPWTEEKYKEEEEKAGKDLVEYEESMGYDRIPESKRPSTVPSHLREEEAAPEWRASNFSDEELEAMPKKEGDVAAAWNEAEDHGSKEVRENKGFTDDFIQSRGEELGVKILRVSDAAKNRANMLSGIASKEQELRERASNFSNEDIEGLTDKEKRAAISWNKAVDHDSAEIHSKTRLFSNAFIRGRGKEIGLDFDPRATRKEMLPEIRKREGHVRGMAQDDEYGKLRGYAERVAAGRRRLTEGLDPHQEVLDFIDAPTRGNLSKMGRAEGKDFLSGKKGEDEGKDIPDRSNSKRNREALARFLHGGVEEIAGRGAEEGDVETIPEGMIDAPGIFESEGSLELNEGLIDSFIESPSGKTLDDLQLSGIAGLQWGKIATDEKGIQDLHTALLEGASEERIGRIFEKAFEGESSEGRTKDAMIAEIREKIARGVAEISEGEDEDEDEGEPTTDETEPFGVGDFFVRLGDEGEPLGGPYRIREVRVDDQGQSYGRFLEDDATDKDDPTFWPMSQMGHPTEEELGNATDKQLSDTEETGEPTTDEFPELESEEIELLLAWPEGQDTLKGGKRGWPSKTKPYHIENLVEKGIVKFSDKKTIKTKPETTSRSIVLTDRGREVSKKLKEEREVQESIDEDIKRVQELERSRGKRTMVATGDGGTIEWFQQVMSADQNAMETEGADQKGTLEEQRKYWFMFRGDLEYYDGIATKAEDEAKKAAEDEAKATKKGIKKTKTSLDNLGGTGNLGIGTGKTSEVLKELREHEAVDDFEKTIIDYMLSKIKEIDVDAPLVFHEGPIEEGPAKLDSAEYGRFTAGVFVPPEWHASLNERVGHIEVYPTVIKASGEPTEEEEVRIIIHEIAHSLTYLAVRNYAENRPAARSMTDESIAAVKEMIALYEEFMTDANGVSVYPYAALNAGEFLAEAYGNRDFKRYLAGRPSESDANVSLYGKLIKAIGKFFGLTKQEASDSRLARIMEVSERIIEGHPQRATPVPSPKKKSIYIRKEEKVDKAVHPPVGKIPDISGHQRSALEKWPEREDSSELKDSLGPGKWAELFGGIRPSNSVSALRRSNILKPPKYPQKGFKVQDQDIELTDYGRNVVRTLKERKAQKDKATKKFTKKATKLKLGKWEKEILEHRADLTDAIFQAIEGDNPESFTGEDPWTFEQIVSIAGEIEKGNYDVARESELGREVLLNIYFGSTLEDMANEAHGEDITQGQLDGIVQAQESLRAKIRDFLGMKEADFQEAEFGSAERPDKPDVESGSPDIEEPTAKQQDYDTRVNTKLTKEEKENVDVEGMVNNESRPLAITKGITKNIETGTVSDFQKSAKILQEYIDDHQDSVIDRVEDNVEVAEKAIGAMEDILTGRNLEFDEDYVIKDSGEAEFGSAERPDKPDVEKIKRTLKLTFLPADLASSSPGYNIGSTRYALIFESDVDKALFIVAQEKKSASDGKFMEWLRRQFEGVGIIALRKAGKEVREHIKDKVSGKPPGEVRIIISEAAIDLGVESGSPDVPAAESPTPPKGVPAKAAGDGAVRILGGRTASEVWASPELAARARKAGYVEHEGRMPQEGDTLEDAIDGVVLNEQQQALWGELAIILQRQKKWSSWMMMPELHVKEIPEEDTSALGGYELRRHVIYLDPLRSKHRVAIVLLHEAVHAATRDAILMDTAHLYHGDRARDVPVRSKEAMARLEQISRWIRAKGGRPEREEGETDKEWRQKVYGLKDTTELITEAFTNPHFQRWMSTIKVPGSTKYADLRGKNLLQSFIDTVKRLLNIRSKRAVTALEEVLGLSHTIMEEDVRRSDQERGAVDAFLAKKEVDRAAPSPGFAEPAPPAAESDPGKPEERPKQPFQAKEGLPTGELSRMPDIVAGRRKSILPAAIPEVMDLIRSIFGEVPNLSKLRRGRGGGKVLGKVFMQKGEVHPIIKIFLDYGAAANPHTLAKVLYHELGHITDFFPEETIKRGNILARLFSLKDYTKSTMPPSREGELDKIRNLAEKEARKGTPRGVAPTREAVNEIRMRMLKESGLVSENKIREELLELTKWWSGSWEDATESYQKYRRSSAELYAEAISVFLLSPGTLRERAPNFYEVFTTNLGKKPEVLGHYYTLQAMLAGTPEELAERRTRSIMEGYRSADVKQRILMDEDERKARSRTLHGTVDWIAQMFQNKQAPGMRRAGKILKSDPDNQRALAAKYLLDELGYSENDNRDFLDDLKVHVWDPAMELGVTREEMGEWLQMHRIVGEGRTTRGEISEERLKIIRKEAKEEANRLFKQRPTKKQMEKAKKAAQEKLGPNATRDDIAAAVKKATEKFTKNPTADQIKDIRQKMLNQLPRYEIGNPGGFTKKTAAEQINAMAKAMGPHKFAEMDKLMKKFHDLVFDVMKRAKDAGVITKDIFDNVVVPNRDNYAAFAPLSHIEKNVTYQLRQQMGSFEQVGNPFDFTIMKMMSMNRIINLTRSQNSITDLLMDHFDKEDEILMVPQSGFSDSTGRPNRDSLPPPAPGHKWLVHLKDGEHVAHQIPEAMVNAFESHDAGQLATIAKAIHDPMYKHVFYPLYIALSPGFMAVNFARDFRRTYNRLGELGAARAAAAGQGFRQDPFSLLDIRPKKWRPSHRSEKITFADIIVAMWEEHSGAWHAARKLPTTAHMKEMMKDKAYSFKWSKGAGYNIEEEGNFKYLMQEAGLMKRPPTEPLNPNASLAGIPYGRLAPAYNPLKKAHDAYPILTKMFGFMEGIGTYQESLFKLAGHSILMDRGLSREEAAFKTRSIVSTPDVRKQGLLHPFLNSVFLFYRTRINGLTEDLKHAADPGTRASFWWRQLIQTMLPVLLFKHALAGKFGPAEKAYLELIPEYFWEGYDVIPLGMFFPGDDDDPNYKTAAITIPLDDTSRMMRLAFSNAIDIYKGERGAWGDLWKGGHSDVIGGLTPPINIMRKNMEWFLLQVNPEDPFKKRKIIPRPDYMAGGRKAHEAMLWWSFNQFGVASAILRFPGVGPLSRGNWYGPDKPSYRSLLFEWAGKLSGIGRYVRFTNAGLSERVYTDLESERQGTARIYSDMPDSVQNNFKNLNKTKKIVTLEPGEPLPAGYTKRKIEYDLLVRWKRMAYDPIRQKIKELDKLRETHKDNKSLVKTFNKEIEDLYDLSGVLAEEFQATIKRAARSK